MFLLCGYKLKCIHGRLIQEKDGQKLMNQAMRLDFSYFHYTKLQNVNYHVVKIILKDLLTLFSLQSNSKLVHYTTYFCVSKINITFLVTK